MSTLDLFPSPSAAPSGASPAAHAATVARLTRRRGRLPLRWQLLGGFGVVLAILSLAGFWTAHIMNETDDAYTALVDGSASEGLVAEQMRAELLGQAEAAKDVFLRGSDAASFAKYAARFDASTVTLRELRARMDALPHLTADERALLQQFDTNWAGYVDAWPKAKAAYQAGNVQDADTIMRGHYPAAASALDQLAVKVESRSRTEGARLAANTDAVTGVVLPLLGFVTLLGLAVALVITRTVTSEVGSAAGALQAASADLAEATAGQSAGAAAQSATIGEAAAAVVAIKEASAQISRRALAICRAAEDETTAARRDLTAVRAALAELSGIAGRVQVVERSVPVLAAHCEHLDSLLVRLDQRSGEQGALLLTMVAQAAPGLDHQAPARQRAADASAVASQAAAVAGQVRPVLAELRRLLPAAAREAVVGAAGLDARVAVIERTIADLSGDLGTAVRSAREIAAASTGHAAAAEQVAAAMASINQTARQNVETAQRAQGAARRLSLLALRLGALITGKGA